MYSRVGAVLGRLARRRIVFCFCFLGALLKGYGTCYPYHRVLSLSRFHRENTVVARCHYLYDITNH